MKAKFYTLLSLACILYCQSTAYSQCTNATYGQFPTYTFENANCNGTPEVIDPSCYAGEYSSVSLINGNSYEFSSNISTDYLTIIKVAGNNLLVTGTSPLTYQATFSGEVFFYTHVSAACDESEDVRERIVTCTAPGPCMNAATFGQFPLETFTPAVCDGVTDEVIAPNCAAGEYSKVNVTAGNTYTFSSSVATDYVTISDVNGTTGLVYNLTPAIFHATTNQVVRFYLHTDIACGEDLTSRSRIVRCGQEFCNTASFGQWPTDTYSMGACNGATEEITPEAFAGEYAMINMEANKAYNLSSSVATDYITVTNSTGNTLMARGVTPLLFNPPVNAEYRYYLHTDIFCGEDATNRSRNIACSGNLDIEEASAFELALYPNPTTSQLTVSANEPIATLQVISIDGKVLLHATPASLATTISLEQFQSGTYFIQATINGIVQMKEVVKQ